MAKPLQRFTWKTVATYAQYEDADADRNDKHLNGERVAVKVKRRGNRYEVRVGTPVKKEEEVVEELQEIPEDHKRFM